MEDERTKISQSKDSLQAEIQSIEAKEHTASTPIKVHEFESERWKKDDELRDIEEKELDIEEEGGGTSEVYTGC